MNRLYCTLISVLLCQAPAIAQDADIFEDDPFQAQQNSMPSRRSRANSGWRPSTYADQNAVIEAMLGQQIKRSLKYRFETTGVLSDGLHSPFWFTSNSQGLSSVENKYVYARYGMFGQMRLPSGFGMKYGMDLGVGKGLHDDWFVQQLYIDFDWKALSLSIGKKERWGNIANPSLSSGELTWSGNCTPIPQARLGFPEYVRLHMLDDWFSIKGHVAYGIYSDSKFRASNPSGKYTDGLWYHSKEAFLKFGDRNRFPLEVSVGLLMHAQFAGTAHGKFITSQGRVIEAYDLPDGLRACWDILLPFNAPGEQGDENGNTLGSWQLALEWHAPRITSRFYYDHFYEDHSSLFGVELKSDDNGTKHLVSYGLRRNWLDGLFGLEFVMPDEWPVRDVVLEFLNTRGLCGPICNLDGTYKQGIDGRDGMYNHGVNDSYTHFGYAVGNPVLLSPVYNSDGSLRFQSNRVNMFHAGVEGGIGTSLDYRVKLTAARHWGCYESPFDETRDVASAFVQLLWLTGEGKSCKIGLAYGTDSDDSGWLGNNRGVMLTFVKSWKIL